MEALATKPSVHADPMLVRWLLGLFAVALSALLLFTGQVNILAALLIGGGLVSIARLDKPLAALLTFAYLFLMGDVRRIVSYIGQPVTMDLLLLIHAVVGVFLAFKSLVYLRLSDKLTKAVAMMLLLMCAELLNPKQGSLFIGLSGGFFYITPLLWFWAGKRYASPVVIEKLLYRVILPCAVLAAILGLCQTFIGFLPWERAWIDQNIGVYKALYVGGSVRAFGFLVSGTEYTSLLTMAVVIIMAAFLAGKRSWSIALPLLLCSVVLASARGPVIKLVSTVLVIWVLRRGRKLTTMRVLGLGLATVASFGFLILAASHLSSGSDGPAYSRSSIQDALSHQIGGFAHPLNEKYSTAGIHTKLIVDGIKTGFSYPIGYGLGSTTMAAFKFGSDASLGSSEVDISDMFICLGFVGGLLYIYIICLTMQRAFTYTRATPRHIGLPVFAVLLCTLGTWLIGGQYSTASLVFFIIGGLIYQPRVENIRTELAVPDQASRVGNLGRFRRRVPVILKNFTVKHR